MNMQQAVNNLRMVGNDFKLSIEESGQAAPDYGSLFYGLSAYHLLNLKGEYDWLDQSVRLIMREMFDRARKQEMAQK